MKYVLRVEMRESVKESAPIMWLITFYDDVLMRVYDETAYQYPEGVLK